MSELLSDDEIDRRLPDGWAREGDEIVRVYEFGDYLDGVAFASDAGEIAEEEFHHPELTIRYGEVEIRLTSHDAGGITERDLALAELFDEQFAASS
ncbi:MAG: 4a-hydroxytetrahydrobiopterin dehydratase [Haloferacaceae archaeon]